MASVNVYTKEYTQTILDQTVIDGYIAGGGTLMLVQQNGGEIAAGSVVGPQGPTGAPGAAGSTLLRWAQGTAYTTGQVVGYGGQLYKAVANSTGACPALSRTNWQPLTAGRDMGVVHGDPNFDSDSLSDHWEPFWGTGTTHTYALTSTAGEFETGFRAFKATLSTSASQRIYPKDETILNSGEVVVMRVRAKVLSGTGVTLTGNLTVSDTAGSPEPFQSGTVVVSQNEATQNLTTSWAWYTLTMVAPNNKPRSMAAAIISTGAGSAATVVVDRIKMRRYESILVTPTDWIGMTLLNGWLHYDSGLAAPSGAGRNAMYRRDETGQVSCKGLVRSGTGVIFTFPAGFRGDVGWEGGMHWPVAAVSAFGAISLNASGGNPPQNLNQIAGSNGWVSLEPLSWRAAA